MLSRLPVIAGGSALVLIAGYAAVFGGLPFDQNPSAWGSFGDDMGGLLNPLISLFTLAVAVKVWQLQKTESTETRNALEEPLKTAEQQRAEARFFDLCTVFMVLRQAQTTLGEAHHYRYVSMSRVGAVQVPTFCVPLRKR